MKKILILVALAIFGLMIACGSSAPAPGPVDESDCDLAEGMELWIESSIIGGKVPDWVMNRPSRGVGPDGNKVIHFYGEGTHAVKTVAVSSAQGAASAGAANAIKQNVIDEYAKVWESVGDPTNKPNYEEVSKGLTATKAKVQLRGAEETGQFTAQVRIVRKVDYNTCKATKQDTVWKCIIQKSLDYDKYVELRDDIVKNSDQLTEQQKRMLSEADSALDELDF